GRGGAEERRVDRERRGQRAELRLLGACADDAEPDDAPAPGEQTGRGEEHVVSLLLAQRADGQDHVGPRRAPRPSPFVERNPYSGHDRLSFRGRPALTKEESAVELADGQEQRRATRLGPEKER